ncbi:(2Fe-2S)-binding protein [Kitasatospora sp. NPDC002227]|uniref:(2Fe-2S)-binding protein n=1 Tax=Kitasatospora sp. NPDC002227 TaxID=3154773 RepID=UPI0033198918
MSKLLELPTPPRSLAGTYRRLLAACEALDVELLPAGAPLRPGWCTVGQLPFAAEELVEAEAARIEAGYGKRPRTHVAASRFLHHYLWSATLLLSGPWYLAGQVPRPAEPRIEIATGRFALCPPQGEPGDPAALRAAVAAQLGPVLAAFQSYVKRGPRALWGMAADDLASGLWYLGRVLGEEERGAELAGLVLPGDTPPFPGAADFRRLPGTEGRSHLTRTRLGCCLYYAVRPAEACLTCPRTEDGERVRRLEL